MPLLPFIQKIVDNRCCHRCEGFAQATLSGRGEAYHSAAFWSATTLAIILLQGAQTVEGQELPPTLNEAFAKGRLKIDCLRVHAELSGTDEELLALCQVESLKSLDLDMEKFTDAGFVDIGKLKKLRVLKLGSTRFSPAALVHLVDLPCLEELSYISTSQTHGAAAEVISRLKHLKRLSLSRGKFTDADIQVICTNKNLESLVLENNKDLTDEALRDVGNLLNLEKLNVTGNKEMGDKACDYISKCHELRDLGICATQVSDRGVEKLLVLRRLDDLGLAGTRITAKSVDRLSALPKLRHLAIFGNDNLGDEIVPFIKKYKSLDTLMCFATKLSPEGLKELAMSRKWKTLWPSPDEGPNEEDDE